MLGPDAENHATRLSTSSENMLLSAANRDRSALSGADAACVVRAGAGMSVARRSSGGVRQRARRAWERGRGGGRGDHTAALTPLVAQEPGAGQRGVVGGARLAGQAPSVGGGPPVRPADQRHGLAGQHAAAPGGDAPAARDHRLALHGRRPALPRDHERRRLHARHARCAPGARRHLPPHRQPHARLGLDLWRCPDDQDQP
eukprot:1793023-Rhodomonas_salina.1